MSDRSFGSGAALVPIDAGALQGFATADPLPAYAAFHRAAGDHTVLRPALPPDDALKRARALALECGQRPSPAVARDFFVRHFTPHRIGADAFFTGYYEPVVAGALEPSAAFSAPVLARPDDLVTFAAADDVPAALTNLSAARLAPDGALAPYPDRAAIEAAALSGDFRPIVWLRDWVEVFLIQVQGSARVRLDGGRTLRLTYAGRNGHPYTSIGRMLVERGAIPSAAMSLDVLKEWLRAGGQGEGEPGRAVMHANASYVFFSAAFDGGETGPTGGAGLPLTELVSIAVDRTRWCYGLPFWVDAMLPWAAATPTRLQRLMIAEDTGSAIVGPARVDLFLGSGETAGRLAGGIRHHGTLTVLLPRPLS